MHAKRELGYFTRAMIGQLRGGCESLAHGPINSAENLLASARWADATLEIRRPRYEQTTVSGAIAAMISMASQ